MNHCGVDTKVIDSRETQGGVRRRRICKVCGYRFSTLEQIWDYPQDNAHKIPPRSELYLYRDNPKKIAEKYNVSVGTAYKWLKHHGLSNKPGRKPKEMLDTITGKAV